MPSKLEALLKTVTLFTVLGAAVFVAYATYSVGRDLLFPYKYMMCVDTFSQQTFETDRSVVEITTHGTSYGIYRGGWDVTMIPKAPNVVCNLSREYPPHVQAQDNQTTQPATEQEQSDRPESTSGYSRRGTESDPFDVRGEGTSPSN